MPRLFPLFALFLAVAARAEINPEWTTPLPPFQIADNLYYVGSQDLAAYLVTSPAGNILINANLETSPSQIRASVEKLGFRWADTKILLNGQAHFDHMAGAAQILRETGAKNMVMDGDGPDRLSRRYWRGAAVPAGEGRSNPEGRRYRRAWRRHAYRAQDGRPHPRMHDVDVARSSSW
jgi:glyoxylase-like metal-dependent hydrolase (beta-lactamase superfamily II)